ncbi:MAG: hypothetical protein HY831_01230 [Candidatus Aenigmarchaeota archaeon]|nr:hypothetical protein [Candidatus Aenigmarchaeota archaeon]
MEFVFSKDKIVFNRVLSELDKFVIDFVKVLNKCNIKYVIVSGYVSIVFGRSRQTEDVDMLVAEVPYEEFEDLWDEITKEFECMNTDNPKDAYENYLKEGSAIRFYRKDNPFPNMEFKFAKEKDDFYSINNSIRLLISGNELEISPIEFHIAYKFYLGSEKDFEDAKFVFNIFRKNIDLDLLKNHLKKLNIDSKLIEEYLGLL